MKPQFASIFLIVGTLALSCPLTAAASNNGIFLSTGNDGSVELSNLSGQPGEELAIAVPEGANPLAASTTGKTFLATPGIPQMTAPNSDNKGTAVASKSADQAETPELSANEQYRNHIQQQMNGSIRNAANPAVSRRYLMQSRPPLASFSR